MAGHNTTATVQTPVVYERMIPHPLDKWSNISSLTLVTTQLPSVIRYVGMLVWVEDKKEFYHFKDGVNDNHLVPLTTSLEGIRTYDTLVNTTANSVIEIKHDLGAANISITFQHNDEMLLVGWKRGKIDGSDKGNYIHFATDVDYVGLRVFIISKDLAPNQPTHPNLDNELSAITLTLNTTHTTLDTMQEVGDAIIALQTTVGNHTNQLTTTNSEYDTFQEIGDKLNSLSENIRDVDKVLSETSTNPVENKVVSLALNTKIGDSPNDNNMYVRKGGSWVSFNKNLVGNIIFLDENNGDDSTAILGDYSKPFRTDSAAFAALSNNVVVNIFITSPNFTFDSNKFPNKYIKIHHLNNDINSTLDFSSFSGSDVSVEDYPLEIIAPNSRLLHSSGVDTNYFGSKSMWTKFMFKSIEIETNSVNGFLYNNNQYSENSFIIAKDLLTVGSECVNTILFSGKIEVGKLILKGFVELFAGGSKNIDINIKDGINCENNDNTIFNKNYIGKSKISIADINVETGTKLYIKKSMSKEILDVRFNNTIISGSGYVYLTDSVNDKLNMFVGGSILSEKGVFINKMSGGSTFGGNIIFDRFISKVEGSQPFNIIEQQNLKFYNCEIKTDSHTFYSTNGQSMGIEFHGVNIFKQTFIPTLKLFTGITPLGEYYKYGKIYTNCTSVGDNVTIIDETPNTL